MYHRFGRHTGERYEIVQTIPRLQSESEVQIEKWLNLEGRQERWEVLEALQPRPSVVWLDKAASRNYQRNKLHTAAKERAWIIAVRYMAR